VGQNVTKLREATHELERVANDLERLIGTANAPIIGVDTEGRVSEWNRKTALMTGFSTREALGQPFVQTFVWAAFRKNVTLVLNEALRGVESDSYSFPLLTNRSKRRVEVLLNVTTRRDAAGKVTGVIGIGQDITELRSAMAARLHVADELERLIDTANAPIIGTDTHGSDTEWNQSAAAITGFSKYEVMGKDLVGEFVTRNYRATVHRVLNDAMRGDALRGAARANFEVPLYHKDGKHVLLLLSATPRRTRDGTIVGVVGVGQDLTELREREIEALEAKQREKVLRNQIEEDATAYV